MVRRAFVSALLVLFLLVPGTRGGEKEDQAIQQSIDQGVAFLRGQAKDGNWPPYKEYPLGVTALAAWTLLECGVSTDDPAIQKAAQIIRSNIVSMDKTYVISLAMLFLDRLGNDDDAPLLQAMAIRLIAGQNATGGWGYSVFLADPKEMRTLLERLQRRRIELIRKGGGPKASPSKPEERSEDKEDLAKDFEEAIRNLKRQIVAPEPGDNSNTQFATLALWVARRQGVPVDSSLAAVAARFRQSQNPDGGWGYHPNHHRSFASLTCAGLIGLATGFGVAEDRFLRTKASTKKNRLGAARKPLPAEKDNRIRAALLLLGTAVGQPLNENAGEDGRKLCPLFQGEGDVFYALWSIERVAVLYDLKTLGNLDWYEWGSKFLLEKQGADGSWQGKYNKTVDTCFALLFLKRANPAKDLTITLKGKMRDPGKVTLKTGNSPAAKGKESEKTEEPSKPASATNKTTPEKGDATDARSEQLARELAKAEPDRQKELIEKYKETKGVEYTQALATAIHKLKDQVKEKAREALAERLGRMTAQTLRDKLQEDDFEIRRAAALACAVKEDKNFVPDLIGLLEDSEVVVARAAYAALKDLTGQDFGPAAAATAAEKASAVNRWKQWWKKQ